MVGAARGPAQSPLVDFYGLTLIARWVLGWLIRPIARSLPNPDGKQRQPSVAVVIPARNESANLPTLLQGLANQTHPAQVIVVDDHSTDETAEIARSFGVEVIAAPDLPSEWTGKAWACWQGAIKSHSELLIFLDADTVPSSNLVSFLVSAVQKHGGLISVQPYHKMVKASERLAAMFNLLGAMGARLGRNGSDRATNLKHPPMAFGPVLATTRKDYELVGGHQTIKSAIVEDVSLGKAYHRNQLPVNTYAGRADVAFRMYPAGLGQMFEGFVKNLATGLANSNPLWSLGVIAWFSGVMVASWELPYALIKWLATGDSPSSQTLSWAVGLYLAYAFQIAVMLRPLGNFGLAAALMPVGVVVFIAVFGWSLISALRGNVRWKGRIVSTRQPRPTNRKLTQ